MTILNQPTCDTSEERTVVVLCITHLEDTKAKLQSVFQHTRWRVVQASSACQGLEILGRWSIGVVICEEDLPDGSWMDVLRLLESREDRALLIVMSRKADERLWAEVLNMGGYDVLPEPFDPMEVTRTISLAWQSWRQTLRLVNRPQATRHY